MEYDFLTVTRMYDMFCEQGSAQRSRNGLEDEIEKVKIHTYRRIFCNEFNIPLQMPKKDRCDLCEEFKNKVNPLLEAIAINSTHIAGKEATKEDCDKNRPIQDNTHAIICFDLQNVISLPRVNVSSFFYRRKFNVYNLTAHCSLGRDGYCAIWFEGMSKRTGNDIASALVKILSSSDCHPEINKMTLWSDSCVAQNKNSVMSFAINHFLQTPGCPVDIIIQKFGQPGHSPIQEVDNIHTQIEKTLSNSEVFSPVSLIRALKRVNRKHPLKIIQMRKGDFWNFQGA